MKILTSCKQVGTTVALSALVISGSAYGLGSIAFAEPAATSAHQTEATQPTSSAPSLSWGYNTEFIKSLNESKWVKGVITVSDGAERAGATGFTWGEGKGSIDEKGKGSIAYPGTLRMQTFLFDEPTTPSSDVKISNVRVTGDGTGKGSLMADVTYLNDDEEYRTIKDIKFADLAFRDLTAAGGMADVTLTRAGSKATNGFYSSKTPMDPLTFTTGKPSTPGNDGDNTTPAASEASLNWGIKRSFTSYIGNVGGTITMGGGTANSNGGTGITWGSGKCVAPLDKNGVGNLAFAGSIHFLAHEKVLDITLSNLRIKITGENKGQLILDAKSRDIPGNDLSKNDVVFADLDFTDLSQTKGSAKTILTADGARIFAGFYQPGIELDPIAFTASCATTPGKDDPGQGRPRHPGSDAHRGTHHATDC